MSDSRVPLPEELSALQEGDPAAIGPYVVVGRLGAGGMGAVYGGLDAAGRCVAVKVIHQRYAQHGEFRARFAREARLMERLDAECAPAFLAADAEAASPWLATEFVPGRTLTAHVRELGPLSGGSLLAFAAGTAEALAAIHGAGVLHRDIKPGNIMLSPDGPRLVDFGIARIIDEEEDSDHIYGTPGYLPPERLDGADSHPAGDVFAWGAVVVYAATGRHAHGMGDVAHVLQRVRTSEHNLAGLPDMLRPLVEAALVPDPAQRPTALDCFTRALELAEPAQSVQDTEQARRSNLRRILAAAWHGFDVAGHDARTWAAFAGAGAGVGTVAAQWSSQEAARRSGEATPSVADNAGQSAEAASGATEATSPGQLAPGSSGTGPGAGPGTPVDPAPAEATPMTGQFAESGHTAAEATAQGAVAASTSGGGGATPAVAAGAASAGVSVKAAAITATAVFTTGLITAGTIIATQGLSDEAAPAKDPEEGREGAQEVVREAALVLEEGEGFTAQVRLTPETSGAAQPVEQQVSYASGDTPVFAVEGEALGGAELVTNVDGEVYAYAWGANGDTFDDRRDPSLFGAETYNLDLVIAPLRSLSEADDLGWEGDEADADGEQVVAGTLTSRVVMDGEVTEEQAEAQLQLNPDGIPDHLTYHGAEWAVELDFSDVDRAPEIEEPEVLYEDWQYDELPVLAAPSCGRITDADGMQWDVRAESWEVSCAQAMDVAEPFTLVEREEYPYDWHPPSDLRTAYIDGFACVQSRPAGEVRALGQHHDRELQLYYCHPAELDASEDIGYSIDFSRRQIEFIAVPQ